ncbi:uncharacterized protein SCHCODRAFT_02475888, partial [Schizophyllum commune H4-8]|uniref:uncharacterized protein n=1 Tax=Schizophyllum commune (strain H4-8 / FGSC 9210) TaxID=578458 RepID=UPI00215EDAB1
SAWAAYLFMMEFVYNSSVHRSTGESPFMLLMGYQPQSMLDRANENSTGKDGASRLTETKEFFADLRIRREAARDAIAAAQDEQARAYNKGRRPPPAFKQGD